MKNKTVCIIMAILDVFSMSVSAVDIVDLQEVSTLRLAQALKSGKTAEITAATAVVESLSRARYLDNMSHANEVIMPLIDGFAPQLAALPDVIKKAGIGAATANDDIPNFAVQMVINFLTAQNAVAAKEAVGDLVPAIDAMNMGSKAQGEYYAKAPTTQSFEVTRKGAVDVAKKTATQHFLAAKAVVTK